ncbi:ABC transporter permease [Rhodococcus rhodochrous]|uniref:ABC transporter permease n=1 Tax=Rhodococcus rhodochrous TaxID=1829 RepID=UPI001E475E7A|nr:ABC transporter permease [Rhodococcus rhodochrous]MCD2097514.1 ABC transporter permease [Rhodococcus rhodochrous]MDJ0018130.1 ABC transporter permease [Rhodococcus rhodochrous]
MVRTVIDKLIELVVVLCIVSLGTFALVSFIPGDPSVAILGEGYAPEDYARVRAEMGLDDPFSTRYWHWLSGALQGDLGTSIVPPQGPVIDSIGEAMPVSLQLALMGLVIAIVVAVPLAVYSARHQGNWIDRAIGAGTFGVLSIPSFLSGLLLIMLAVNHLGWFPRSQWVRISEGLGQNLYHAILPAIAISLLEMAMFTRILRSDLVMTLGEKFILVAKAKGMSNTRLLFSDALRPSSFSLITMLGVVLGSMIGSTVIVETLFSLPGMGSLIVRAAQQGDMPMVQGAVLVIAVIYVVANGVIDIAYGYLDPRSRRAHV